MPTKGPGFHDDEAAGRQALKHGEGTRTCF